VTTMTNLLAGGTGAVPSYVAPAGVNSGNYYGTGYTTNTISGSSTSYAASPTA